MKANPLLLKQQLRNYYRCGNISLKEFKILYKQIQKYEK